MIAIGKWLVLKGPPEAVGEYLGAPSHRRQRRKAPCWGGVHGGAERGASATTATVTNMFATNKFNAG
ncbi:hypothetical protein GCM10010246_04200 [Streptomyces cuspidosporus]|uniref:Uncharacterized protein n=1 Tax=Streptomyces cuspidosporus TaxID=66882 RepID=A0ABN3FBA3_9ACTN